MNSFFEKADHSTFMHTQLLAMLREEVMLAVVKKVHYLRFKFFMKCGAKCKTYVANKKSTRERKVGSGAHGERVRERERELTSVLGGVLLIM